MFEGGFDQRYEERPVDRRAAGFKETAAAHQDGLAEVTKDYRTSVSGALQDKSRLTLGRVSNIVSRPETRAERIINNTYSSIGGKPFSERLSISTSKVWSKTKDVSENSTAGELISDKVARGGEFLEEQAMLFGGVKDCFEDHGIRWERGSRMFEKVGRGAGVRSSKHSSQIEEAMEKDRESLKDALTDIRERRWNYVERSLKGASSPEASEAIRAGRDHEILKEAREALKDPYGSWEGVEEILSHASSPQAKEAMRMMFDRHVFEEVQKPFAEGDFLWVDAILSHASSDEVRKLIERGLSEKNGNRFKNYQRHQANREGLRERFERLKEKINKTEDFSTENRGGVDTSPPTGTVPDMILRAIAKDPGNAWLNSKPEEVQKVADLVRNSRSTDPKMTDKKIYICLRKEAEQATQGSSAEENFQILSALMGGTINGTLSII